MAVPTAAQTGPHGMTQPVPYNRAFNFANYQSANPTTPLPGGSLDEELSRVKQTTDQIRANLALIQRDDTALANRSVGFDQLKTEVAIGINPPSPWVPNKNYVVRDTVFTNSNFYICDISHVSGVFADDLADGKWSLIASFEAATSADSVTYNDSTTELGSGLVQGAIEALKSQIDDTNADVAGLNGTNIAIDPAAISHSTSTNAQAVLEDIDTALDTLDDAITARTPGAAKATPVDADYLPLYDSAASFSMKKLTWAALKTALGAVFAPISLATTALLKSGGTMTGDLILKGNPTSGLMAATKQYVDALPITKVYESPEQAITAGGTITLSHGLGDYPKIVTAVLVCKTADQGFAIGSQITYWAGFHTDSGNSRGCHVMSGPTQLYVQYSNQGGGTFQVFNTSGGVVTLTNDNWRLVVRAYA